MTDPERYLAKARESLASAEADVVAGRHNSAANRSYYAGYQSTLAALISIGIAPRGNDWEHRFVMDRFSVTLVRGRKLLPSRYRRALDDLFGARVTADYRTDSVTKVDARDSVKTAQGIVEAVERLIETKRTAEPQAEYGSQKVTTAREYRKKAAGFIRELKDLILAKYPDSTFEIQERSPKDYRMIVQGNFDDSLDIRDLIGCRKIDMLTEHDIWIVLLAVPREQAA